MIPVVALPSLNRVINNDWGKTLCCWKELSVAVDGYLATAVADLVIGIVDAAKLPGGNALNGLVGVDVIALIIQGDDAWHEVVDVAHLEGDGHFLLFEGGWEGTCDEVHVRQTEVVAVLQLGVPSVSNEDDVLLHVLFHDKPRSTA